MAEEDLIQLAREQRLMTLALADQVDGARWSEPALPGERSPHAMLSHLLGWDEWLIAQSPDTLGYKLIRVSEEYV